MEKFVLDIKGMKCHMCEKHVIDLLTNDFSFKKVKASFEDDSCSFMADSFDETKLKEAIKDLGFELINIKKG